ncbi:MAG: hypothetical protein AAGH46_10595 [Bacteroidota bacterium]
MKKLRVVLIFTFALCFNCDEIEELLEEDIEVNIAFQGKLAVQSPILPDPQDAVQIDSEEAVYDIYDDPEISELIATFGPGTGNVEKIEITQIRYLFQDFEGNTDAIVVGNIGVVANSTSFQNFPTVQTNLAKADENNSLFTIDGDFTTINESITRTGRVFVVFTGSASDNPVSFNVDVTILVKVTISPPDL